MVAHAHPTSARRAQGQGPRLLGQAGRRVSRLGIVASSMRMTKKPKRFPEIA